MARRIDSVLDYLPHERELFGDEIPCWIQHWTWRWQVDSLQRLALDQQVTQQSFFGDTTQVTEFPAVPPGTYVLFVERTTHDHDAADDPRVERCLTPLFDVGEEEIDLGPLA